MRIPRTQRKHRMMNPPMTIPAHAIGRPDSSLARSRFSEMIPYVNATMPEMKLAGKQMKPVSGSGSIVPHKVRTVRMPKIRLMMECLLVGGTGVNSIGGSIIESGYFEG